MNKLIFIIGIAMAIAISSCSGNKNVRVADNSSSNNSNDSPADDPGIEPEVIASPDSAIFSSNDTCDYMIKKVEEQYEEKPSDYELHIKN